MSVVAFLRGCPTRTNPEPDWTLRYRHAEGGAWTPVRRGEQALLRDEILAPTFEWGRGDLATLSGPDGRVARTWVGTLHGFWDAGPVPEQALGPHGGDWPEAWEGPGADAQDLIRYGGRVGRGPLLLACCACADAVADLFGPGDDAARSALAAVRAWGEGRGELDAVRDADPPELRAYGRTDGERRGPGAPRVHALGVVSAARDVALAGDARQAETDAAHAVYLAIVARLGEDPARAPESEVVRLARSFGGPVRAHLPLSRVLLARARDGAAP